MPDGNKRNVSKLPSDTKLPETMMMQQSNDRKNNASKQATPYISDGGYSANDKPLSSHLKAKNLSKQTKVNPSNGSGLVMTGHQVVEGHKKVMGGVSNDGDPNQSFNSERSKHHTVHVPTFSNMG